MFEESKRVSTGTVCARLPTEVAHLRTAASWTTRRPTATHQLSTETSRATSSIALRDVLSSQDGLVHAVRTLSISMPIYIYANCLPQRTKAPEALSRARFTISSVERKTDSSCVGSPYSRTVERYDTQFLFQYTIVYCTEAMIRQTLTFSNRDRGERSSFATGTTTKSPSDNLVCEDTSRLFTLTRKTP